jgi:hypothetical protein
VRRHTDFHPWVVGVGIGAEAVCEMRVRVLWSKEAPPLVRDGNEHCWPDSTKFGQIGTLVPTPVEIH